MDWAILGSADHHQAWACIDNVDATIKGGMSEAFFRKCHEWQKKAAFAANLEVGFCHGRIEHLWHGNKSRRYYRERWDILIDNKYDPDTQLMHDEAGLSLLINNPRLEIEIRRYNRSRMEDSLD